ncbi:hypothetical protein V1477_002942 [Vespula maculifrons]|uniref:Uncharacterized protein n=1 Tax=Vespula maculifrons TaxID=7453 RepID=A0ABD2CUR3_VESMC
MIIVSVIVMIDRYNRYLMDYLINEISMITRKELYYRIYFNVGAAWREGAPNRSSSSSSSNHQQQQVVAATAVGVVESRGMVARIRVSKVGRGYLFIPSPLPPTINTTSTTTTTTAITTTTTIANIAYIKYVGSDNANPNDS